jgi:D-sedoheptulose 7-phosphate isomerase
MKAASETESRRVNTSNLGKFSEPNGDKSRPKFEATRIVADYLTNYKALLLRVNPAAIDRVVQRLRLARDNGSTVFVAGNGGSSATASHWVNDLGKATKISGRLPMRAMSLSDNIPWLTALANDEGYDRIFCGQLENFARAGDVLAVISASGNSPNLVRAVEFARQNFLTTIGLLGFDGGVLKGMVDDYVWLPTAKGMYGLVEDSQTMVCHILTTCLMQDRSNEES